MIETDSLEPSADDGGTSPGSGARTSPADAPRPTIADLPFEVLQHALSLLDRPSLTRALRVSHLWFDAACPLLHADLDLDGATAQLLLDAPEHRLAAYSRWARRATLLLTGTDVFPPRREPPAPGFALAHLRSMTDPNAFEDPADPTLRLPGPRVLTAFGSSLRALDLRCTPSRVPLAFAPVVARSLPALSSLTLRNWDASFAAFRLSRPGLVCLRSLDLRGCTISLQDLSDFLCAHPMLAELSVRRCNIGEPVDALSVLLLSQIFAAHADNLEILVLVGDPFGRLGDSPAASSPRLGVFSGMLPRAAENFAGRKLRAMVAEGLWDGYPASGHGMNPTAGSQAWAAATLARRRFWVAVGEQLYEESEALAAKIREEEAVEARA